MKSISVPLDQLEPAPSKSISVPLDQLAAAPSRSISVPLDQLAAVPSQSISVPLTDLKSSQVELEPSAPALPQGVPDQERHNSDLLQNLNKMGFPVKPSWALGMEPEIPQYDYEKNGTYYRVIDGRPVPVWQNTDYGVMYDPSFDGVLDLATGGTWGLRKAAGQSIFKLFAPQAGKVARATLKSMGGKALAKDLAKRAGSEAAWGGLVGGSMEATNQATDSQLAGLAAGLGSPLGARLALSGARKAAGKGLEAAAHKAAKGSWSWPIEGKPSHSLLMRKLGTRAEAIGPDVAGKLLSTEAKLNLDLMAIRAEMGKFTLNDNLVNFLTGKRLWSDTTGLILGQKARDLAARVSPRMAAKMGLTPDELRQANVLAETTRGVDLNGVLQFGVMVKGKKVDGKVVKAWAHGLDPGQAQAAFAGARPEMQKLVLAYRMPAGGYTKPISLPPPGYNPRTAALSQVSQMLDLDTDHMANELGRQGKAPFVGALAAGGVDEQQARMAADRLGSMSAAQRAGLRGVSGQGKLGPEIMAPEVLGKPGLASLASDPLHRQLVKAGILEEGQYLPGYVSHAGVRAGETGVSTQTPTLQLNKMFEPMAQQRWKSEPTGARLDEAIVKQRSFAQEAMSHRALLKKIAPTILQPVPAKESLAPEAMKRVRRVYDPAAGRVVERFEVMTEVNVRPDEAKVLGINPGRYLMPTALDDQFQVLMGRRRSGQEETVLADGGRALRDLASYWVMNVLSAPGTVATNLAGGAFQYSGKWWEDLGRGSARQIKNTTLGPLLALTPKYRHMVPKEMFGQHSNLWRALGEDAGHFMHKTRQAMRDGEEVGLGKKALAAGDAALAGALKANLAPFSSVEDYWKRAVFISEARTLAENHVDDLIKAGKAQAGQRGKLVKQYIGGMLDERPNQFSNIMLGPVDRFAYLYQNIPKGLEWMRQNPLMRMIYPFATFPYKYSRMVGSQLNAFNPLSAMPMKERVARAGGLLGSAAAPYLALEAYLKATGQESEVEQLQERFRQEHPGEQWPGTRTGGRAYIGDAAPGPEGQKREQWLRTIKYGQMNLWPLTRGTWDLLRHGDSGEIKAVLDDMKSVGPLAPLAGQFFEMQPRFGPQDVAGQGGELASGFIPLHRWLEYIAKMGDRDEQTGEVARRTPRTAVEQIKSVIPGLRGDLHQPVDRVTGRPRTWNSSHETLKFFTGINPRDIEVAREAKAVAGYNLRQGKEWIKAERLADYFVGQHPQLSYDKLLAHKDKIMQAGQDTLRKLGKGREYQLFNAVREQAGEGFDPFDLSQQEALEKVSRKYSLTNRDLVRQWARFVGANNWIMENWDQLKED